MHKEISHRVDPKYKEVYGVRANCRIKKYLGRQFLPHHPTAKLINARAQNLFESFTILHTVNKPTTAIIAYSLHKKTTLALEHGIKHQTTVGYSPQQNGIAECMNHTLQEMMNAMLKDAGLPNNLWGEAIKTATFICNRCPSRWQNTLRILEETNPRCISSKSIWM